ncbi:MAG TPA: HD domain-containing protein [Terrisporobacter glycolicus]|uniref:3'-5' exoribonuclease YhaM n=1 Tax=Terrisporobacter petrolearius TaxID=1460447 RepID=A0ABZ3FD71_9FIRM|nr:MULTISPECIES: 3'-5' exoribonuclease YhaM family protein [Terrisporobacter]MBN9647340.1 3'-5' exoribonuclease YhaM family protein [Terrisporobacter glycolicus]SFJ35595.1 3'-5' exoribonuclease [Terrisporobacter glycolicus]HBI91316.1 HD domain-containing protein [Terrisporobacter hibernicus]
MAEKKSYLKDLKDGSVKISLMVNKKLYKDGNKMLYLLSDKSGYINAKIPVKVKLEPGEVIEIEGVKNYILDVFQVKIIEEYNVDDYLATVSRNIDEIMEDIEAISRECIISPQGKILDDYFFKDEKFLEKFKRGIGGVSMHHNYIGGLAEHTLGVMYLTKTLCDIYDCRRREIAVLSAKLHDIGKIYEMDYSGPFKYTLEGELEGHIVIGVQMIDRAIIELNIPFGEDFITRIKGCITQHHGKLEYGSPKKANMEESIILNFADTVDASLNKINKIKEETKEDTWSIYDKKMETKLYL